MQKVVLSLDVHDDKKCKQKVMMIASGVSDIDSISLEMKEKKLTLIGRMDPVEVVTKLRKVYRTEILALGPAKEPEKPKDEPKNVVQVKDEPKNIVQVIDYSKPYSYYPYYCPPLYSNCSYNHF